MNEKIALKQLQPEHAEAIKQMIDKRIDSVSDKKIDEFFNKLIVANKKYYPNYDLAFKILKQMIKDLEASAN